MINPSGTVRPNRKHFPKNLAPCKMKQGDLAVKFCNGMTAMCWKDKRQVLGSDKGGFVTLDKPVNILHIEGGSVWWDKGNATECRRLLDVEGAVVNIRIGG
ncbi:hypothetical protein TNCT_501321 [Trichonephila clavata]|uniref:Uncharacterized protein n=1 Tax=Trichonephila clavata TaxID=2740835 RepID=A0A8X6IE49_TRICU|nr:hypothetical protein TNCT_501321 [Trichonephila clavata]